MSSTYIFSLNDQHSTLKKNCSIKLYILKDIKFYTRLPKRTRFHLSAIDYLAILPRGENEGVATCMWLPFQS